MVNSTRSEIFRMITTYIESELENELNGKDRERDKRKKFHAQRDRNRWYYERKIERVDMQIARSLRLFFQISNYLLISSKITDFVLKSS